MLDPNLLAVIDADVRALLVALADDLAALAALQTETAAEVVDLRARVDALDTPPEPLPPLPAPTALAVSPVGFAPTGQAIVRFDWAIVDGAAAYLVALTLSAGPTRRFVSAVPTLTLDSLEPGAAYAVSVAAARDTADQGGAAVALTFTTRTPVPGPQPGDTITTWDQLAAAADRDGIAYIATDLIASPAGVTSLDVRAGARIVGAPDLADRPTISMTRAGTAEGHCVHNAGTLEALRVLGPGDGDRGCVEMRGASTLRYVDLLDGGGSALAAFGGDDDPVFDLVAILGWHRYAAYVQGRPRGTVTVGPRSTVPASGDFYAWHSYSRDTTPEVDLALLTPSAGRIMFGGLSGLGRSLIRAHVDYPGAAQRTAAVQVGYNGHGGPAVAVDVTCGGVEYGAEVGGPFDELAVRSVGASIGGAVDWGQHWIDGKPITNTPIGAAGITAMFPSDDARRAFAALWGKGTLPAGWVQSREVAKGTRLRIVEAVPA